MLWGLEVEQVPRAHVAKGLPALKLLSSGAKFTTKSTTSPGTQSKEARRQPFSPMRPNILTRSVQRRGNVYLAAHLAAHTPVTRAAITATPNSTNRRASSHGGRIGRVSREREDHEAFTEPKRSRGGRARPPPINARFARVKEGGPNLARGRVARFCHRARRAGRYG